MSLSGFGIKVFLENELGYVSYFSILSKMCKIDVITSFKCLEDFTEETI